MISDAERRVLTHLSEKEFDSPSNIGWALVEGRDLKAARRGNAQGLGRIGGGMCRKMMSKGLVDDVSAMRRGFPAYAITKLGRASIIIEKDNRKMPSKKNDYESMYLAAIKPDGVLPKSVILETLVRVSGDCVAVAKIKLDAIEVWRDGKKVATVKTVREVFALVEKGGW